MSERETRGRTPPYNLDAERALLGALLLDAARIEEVSDVVRAGDFHDGRHGALFETLHQMAEQSTPVDFISVEEALHATGRFEKVGGREALLELAESVTSAAHVMHHARIVSDAAALRRLIAEATEIIAEASRTRPDGDEVQRVLDASEYRIFNVARTRELGQAEPISEAIKETFRRIDANAHRGGLTGITSGYADLDELLCGLNAGDLVVVAGRPSMGKTAFALNVAANTALVHSEVLGRRPTVLIFSLEMGRQAVVARMLCSHARVPAHRLRSGRIRNDERQELVAAADEMQAAQLFIDDSPSVSMLSLRSRARRLKAQRGLDLVIVDYLQLLSFPGAESRQQEISSISRSLKALARELEIPVVALAQLSRAVENRDPPRPQLADLRESGSIEQDADVVLLLYRPSYYGKAESDDDESLAEVICSKQRNGPTGTVKLRFFGDVMRFENRAPIVDAPIVPSPGASEESPF